MMLKDETNLKEVMSMENAKKQLMSALSESLQQKNQDIRDFETARTKLQQLYAEFFIKQGGFQHELQDEVIDHFVDLIQLAPLQDEYHFKQVITWSDIVRNFNHWTLGTNMHDEAANLVDVLITDYDQQLPKSVRQLTYPNAKEGWLVDPFAAGTDLGHELIQIAKDAGFKATVKYMAGDNGQPYADRLQLELDLTEKDVQTVKDAKKGENE